MINWNPKNSLCFTLIQGIDIFYFSLQALVTVCGTGTELAEACLAILGPGCHSFVGLYPAGTSCRSGNLHLALQIEATFLKVKML